MNCRVGINGLNSHHIQRGNLDACIFKSGIIPYFKELLRLVCWTRMTNSFLFLELIQFA